MAELFSVNAQGEIVERGQRRLESVRIGLPDNASPALVTEINSMNSIYQGLDVFKYLTYFYTQPGREMASDASLLTTDFRFMRETIDGISDLYEDDPQKQKNAQSTVKAISELVMGPHMELFPADRHRIIKLADKPEEDVLNEIKAMKDRTRLVNHHLRNNITSVSGYLEVVQEGRKSSLQRALDMAEKAFKTFKLSLPDMDMAIEGHFPHDRMDLSQINNVLSISLIEGLVEQGDVTVNTRNYSVEQTKALLSFQTIWAESVAADLFANMLLNIQKKKNVKNVNIEYTISPRGELMIVVEDDGELANGTQGFPHEIARDGRFKETYSYWSQNKSGQTHPGKGLAMARHQRNIDIFYGGSINALNRQDEQGKIWARHEIVLPKKP